MREAIELPFGTVGGVAVGIGVLNGSAGPLYRGRGDFAGFSPIGLNGVLVYF